LIGINCAGTITSAGHNIESANTCGFAAVGDLINTNPILGPLQSNGGPTFTRALLAGSPAIDAATACSAQDQRGSPRSGAACDIGAYEFFADVVSAVPTSVPTMSEWALAIMALLIIGAAGRSRIARRADRR
jgi:hypothetical protein